MNVAFDFSGRVVIVTGAARGIGRVMVERFAAAGASVVAADRDGEGLAETCGALDPGRVASLVADVSAEDQAASRSSWFAGRRGGSSPPMRNRCCSTASMKPGSNRSFARRVLVRNPRVAFAESGWWPSLSTRKSASEGGRTPIGSVPIATENRRLPSKRAARGDLWLAVKSRSRET